MTEPDADILISRLVDREGTEAEWSAFRALADADPARWRDLAEAQACDARLRHAVSEATLSARRLPAPLASPAEAMHARIRAVMTWGGWLAAASIALAAVALPRSAGPRTVAGVPGGALVATDPDQALAHYLDVGRRSGQVVGELPQKVLLDALPAQAGRGAVVWYVRQIIERAEVEDLYRLATDELGRPVPVRIDMRIESTGDSM